jgi:5-oxoprolinase (ATP-hydrolysing)
VTVIKPALNVFTAEPARWQFWIDRGGTFTDIVAQDPQGQLRVHKLLSENPEWYTDAAIQGIRDILQLTPTDPIPTAKIAAIKMGTTVATNALLERKGARTLLVITQGFGDLLRIGYQNRPQIFAQQIVLPEMLYEQVVEVAERYSAQGEELIPLTSQELQRCRDRFQSAYDSGIQACAIALMHGYRYPQHEQQLAEVAESVGFQQISISSQVSPLIKLVSRGDTTVVDAYLSPILRRYVAQVTQQLALPRDATTKLLFMQSNGGLTDAQTFQGKDSILSGPAGGIVGAVQTSAAARLTKIIGFDMGGTSTDVTHYAGELERSFETEVAGVRLQAPMLAIHTVAAGGGSIIFFDGARYRVGPESAGANPGPACYRRGGPLTVTDCNVLLGRLQPAYFPQVFGPTGNLGLDLELVQQRFSALTRTIAQATGTPTTPEQVASGFLAIAVTKMAQAIKKISVQRGYDLSDYSLCCFGGAGGQHACAIAEALGMGQILIHPLAGVLSAYGMGLAPQTLMREQTVELPLDAANLSTLTDQLSQLVTTTRQALQAQVPATQIQIIQKLQLRYQGTDATLGIPWGSLSEMQQQFEATHQQRYGFITPATPIIVAALAVEGIAANPQLTSILATRPRTTALTPTATVQMYGLAPNLEQEQWQQVPLYTREQLLPGDNIAGPAIILDGTGTNVIAAGWQTTLIPEGHLLLTKRSRPSLANQAIRATPADPVYLEIFNYLFMAIAEQMGVTLQNTSTSVNIKERLDFSCALFDQYGQLVANAPHIPVHLGSMGEGVTLLLQRYGQQLKPGDVYVLNDPYSGGTHLPDITVITPVFSPTPSDVGAAPIFFVASRGHHADIGGMTPGSMPAYSQTIEQEGVLIDFFKLIDQGQWQEPAFLDLLCDHPYPARNPSQNLADLKAQVAANAKGVQDLQQAVQQFGLATVQAYMQHIQDNAEAAVRQAIAALQDGQFTYNMDDGCQVQVAIKIEPHSRSAIIDFTGTSPQQPNNFNAPLAVCKAAVLYVFRTLVAADIPLNAGCLRPLQIIVPAGCLLNPCAPAAVVAGNVETSQVVTDALYGALGVMAAAQGTMNNFTFGNQRYQYYETICGGSGAGRHFAGTDAVQTHMTNSRLTDPEVLEWRFPVVIEDFRIRPSSGGTGQYPGGNGVLRRIRFREPMTATIVANRRVVPPFGLAGGSAGSLGYNQVRRQDGTIESLPSCVQTEMQCDDVFEIATPGGGGYGMAQ